MIPYASATAGKRNAGELERHGFGCVVEPRTLRMIWHGRLLVDNGAFGCWTAGVEWVEETWREMLSKLREAPAPHGILGAVVPDVVGDARATLDLVDRYVDDAMSVGGVAMLALQDGMVEADVEAVCRRHGIGMFLGGTTGWKEATMMQWGRLAKRLGTYYHVARVNSWRRVSMCHEAGADSFDGTSATRFSKNAAKVARWAAHQSLFGVDQW